MIRSLHLRLMIGAATLAVIFMLLMLPALQGAFSLALRGSIEQRLASDVTTLISAARVENGRLLMPSVLPGEQFNLPGSRLLGYIYNRQGDLVWRSLATEDENIDYQPRYDGKGSEFSLIREANGEEFFVYDVEIRLLGGRNAAFSIVALTGARLSGNRQRAAAETLSGLRRGVDRAAGLVVAWFDLGPARVAGAESGAG